MDEELEPIPRNNDKIMYVTSFAAALLGVALGWLAYGMLVEPEVVIPDPTVIKDQISDEDLAILCEELTEDEKTKVKNAQGRVSTLQAELDAKTAELREMKKDAAKNKSNQAAAKKRWDAMESEVASLRVQLAAAEAERDDLREDLRETLVELDHQIRQTNKFKKKAKRYKQESTANLWSAFSENAKVQICDRGSRKRHAKCHLAVNGAFNDSMRDKFTVCVDTYQAVPVLKKAEKGESLPLFSAWLPDDNKFTRKGWFVVFCDPTLPEADDADLRNVEAQSRDVIVPSGSGASRGSGSEKDAMDDIDWDSLWDEDKE